MKKILVILLLVAVILSAGCNTNNKKKAEMISNAYDRYHPVYGYRNELPDRELEISGEGESLWQRPPERVIVRRTPDGPETGSFSRAPVDQHYLGYKEGDDVVLEKEMWHKTRNLTTREPVKELPDYLKGDYGSASH